MELLQIQELQPIINIGVIGHVSNGKSSIVKGVTGIATQKYESEKEKNITIKLGYANAKIYKCHICKVPSCYQTGPSKEFNKNCNICDSAMELVRHVSFVDAPGHIRFMSTMISGKCIMDTTILVEAINNANLPAPQTLEHINAITIGGVPNHIVCLNKCDLVDKETALAKIKILNDAFSSTILKNSPMVPISATFGINMDVLCEYIANIPVPIRNHNTDVKMIIVRSFNVNKAGINVKDIQGGVIGGSIINGKLNIGDEVELRPGFRNEISCDENSNNSNNSTGKKSKKYKERWSFTPLKARVLSIHSEENKLQSAIPGGLIGVQLDIDPSLTAGDGLIGNLLTKIDKGYDVYEEFAINYKTVESINDILEVNDKIQININACNTNGIVTKFFKEDNIVVIKLDFPVSAGLDDNLTICNNGRIFAIGKIVDGFKSILIS